LVDLQRNGIAITSVGELLGNSRLFEDLDMAVQALEASLADEINEAREHVNMPGRNKRYVVELLGHRPTLDPDDIFARFALQPEVLSLVNRYFGMWTKLWYYNVWHNIPTHEAPRESQLWHRDPEDRYILKMFVYLTDVDEGAGPLSYAPGTHAQGTIKSDAEATLVREGNVTVRRSDDRQMHAVVPKQHWITATGAKGTVVLADTRGYHKGGHACTRDRILYMCMYCSQANTYPDVFVRKLSSSTHNKTRAFAVGSR
jgi:hypothetical protein